MRKKKIIAILRGGLGNQLFTYAFAKSLAIKNDFELVLNYRSGFEYDLEYKRTFLLNYFNHSARLANKNEMLIPFHKIRRILILKANRFFPSLMPDYILQKNTNIDFENLNKKLDRTTIVDGCWISEEYFKEIRNEIRKDFTTNFKLPDSLTKLLLSIKKNNSVAIHIRWFNKNGNAETHNLNARYYEKAINEIKSKIDNPFFYIFTDEPHLIEKKINFKSTDFTLINHSKLPNNEIIDFILMQNCKHFIIANSTFSWWAAWLSVNEDKIIISPDIKMTGLTTWGQESQVPNHWIQIKV